MSFASHVRSLGQNGRSLFTQQRRQARIQRAILETLETRQMLAWAYGASIDESVFNAGNSGVTMYVSPTGTAGGDGSYNNPYDIATARGRVQTTMQSQDANRSDVANNISVPYWLKLVRSGNTFTAYTAPDVSGVAGTWTQAGGQKTIAMGSNYYAGLLVNNSQYWSNWGMDEADAVFSNITLNGNAVSSSAWKSVRLGTNAIDKGWAGNWSVSGNTLSVSGGGYDASGTGNYWYDNGNYVYFTLSGDSTVVARVNSLSTSTNTNAGNASLVMREKLATDGQMMEVNVSGTTADSVTTYKARQMWRVNRATPGKALKIVFKAGTYTSGFGEIPTRDGIARDLPLVLEGEKPSGQTGQVIFQAPTTNTSNFIYYDYWAGMQPWGVGNNLVLRNLQVRNFDGERPFNIGGWSPYVLTNKNFLMEDITIDGSARRPTLDHLTNFTMRNVTFSNNASGGLWGILSEGEMINVSFTSNSGGETFWNALRNVRIDNMVMNNNSGAGFRNDHVAENILIENSQFNNQAGQAMMFETAIGPITVKNSQFRFNDPGTGTESNGVISLAVAHNVTFDGCLFEGNKVSVFDFYDRERAHTANNEGDDELPNNLDWANWDQGDSADARMIPGGKKPASWNHNTTVINSTFKATGTSTMFYRSHVWTSGERQWAYNTNIGTELIAYNNTYYNADNTTPFEGLNQAKLTLAQWKTMSTQANFEASSEWTNNTRSTTFTPAALTIDPSDANTSGTQVAPGRYWYEVENLSYTVSQKVNGGAQDVELITDSAASGGKLQKLHADVIGQTGDYITYTLNVPTAGTYYVVVRYLSDNGARKSLGYAQLSVDGNVQGSYWDESGLTRGFMDANLGSVSLSAGNHTFRLDPVWRNGYVSSSYDITIDRIELVSAQDLRPSANPSTAGAGLDYKYYTTTGSWYQLPDFASLTPASTGTVTNFSLSPAGATTTKFAILESGLIDVPADGLYTFYVKMQDGANLWIGDTLVVDANGYHDGEKAEPWEKLGFIALKAGKHPIKLAYFNGDKANRSLVVSWAGPNLAKQVIPDSRLYRRSTNSAPSVTTNAGLSLNTSSSSVIGLSQLKLTDGQADTITYTLTAIPSSGSLKLNGNTLASGARFTQADIDQQRLSYVAGSTAGSYSFSFTASDGQGGSVSATTFSITVTAPSSAPLISSGRSATASSLESSSFPATNVTDGSLSTRWASQQGSDNQWIYIDLGGSYNVSRIRLHWETAAGRDYKLQVKADNPGVDTGWTDLQSITSNTTANAWLDYTGLSGTGRYVRVRATARATSWGYSIKEFEVYGTAVAATPAKLSGTVIGTTGSWNNSGNTRDKAFDGDLNTFFDAPTGDGNWVGLDLGTAKTITSIKFAPRSGFASRMVGGYFQVSNSADFSSATTIHTISSTPTVGSLTSVTVSVEGTWRYIRFVSPTGGYGNIAEFEAWGY